MGTDKSQFSGLARLPAPEGIRDFRELFFPFFGDLVELANRTADCGLEGFQEVIRRGVEESSEGGEHDGGA